MRLETGIKALRPIGEPVESLCRDGADARNIETKATTNTLKAYLRLRDIARGRVLTVYSKFTYARVTIVTGNSRDYMCIFPAKNRVQQLCIRSGLMTKVL